MRTRYVSEITESIVEILTLNTRLFRNCLTGTDDRTIRQRITGNTNSLHFLGCHLVEERFFISTLAGVEAPSPFPELASVRTIDQMPEPGPSLHEIVESWDYISSVLPERLVAVEEEKLMSKSQVSFPTSSSSLLGGLTFLMQHESYHIGQMALIRKALGFDAMSYK